MNKVLDMLNDQMNFEYESAYIYKAMSAYTEDLDLEGFTHRLDKQVEEEVMHGEKMRKFLQSLGYRPNYKVIAEPQADYDGLLDLLKAALEHEKVVTKRILDISEAAKEEDLRVFSFIQWYIDEQVEEEETFNKLITRLERVGDDWQSIYIMDQALSQRGASQQNADE